MSYNCIICNKPKYKRFRSQATFHAFPKCPIQKQVWMNICNISSQTDMKYRKICCYHFEPECYTKSTKRRLLKPNAIPTIFVKRFMKKENFDLGILEETSNIRNLRNNCILCSRSEIKYYPKTKIPLHAFPSCPQRRQEWMNLCQLTDDDISRNNKICSLHFEHSCYKPNGKIWSLNPDAIPTIFELGRYYNRKRHLLKTFKVKITPANQTNNNDVKEVKIEYYPTTEGQTTKPTNN